MASEIVGDINFYSLRFEWEIHLCNVRWKSIGEYLDSPKFTANCDNKNIQWHLRFYPKGLGIDSQDYCFFSLLVGNPNPRKSNDFMIINHNGHNIGAFDSIGSMHWPQYNALGVRYISRHFVENPANSILNLGNNTLKFRFQLKLEMKKATNNEVNVRHRLEVIDNYEALINDRKFSDISLISEGKTIRAHKCILANSSPVFAAMFDSKINDENQENTVKITDIKYSILLEMIRFVYAGKVNQIDIALVGELAVAAENYALTGLKNTCENIMLNNLRLDNVIEYFLLANKIRMHQLRTTAIKFIYENMHYVNLDPGFNLLPYDIQCKIYHCLNKYN